MISNFDDFKAAYGNFASEPVKMKTHSGDEVEILIAGVGAKARDKIQALAMAMMEFNPSELAKGKQDNIKFNFDKLEGDSALVVSFGAINENGERYMDNPEALEFLKTSVLPAELDRVAARVKELSGIAEKSSEESEKN